LLLRIRLLAFSVTAQHLPDLVRAVPGELFVIVDDRRVLPVDNLEAREHRPRLVRDQDVQRLVAGEHVVGHVQVDRPVGLLPVARRADAEAIAEAELEIVAQLQIVLPRRLALDGRLLDLAGFGGRLGLSPVEVREADVPRLHVADALRIVDTRVYVDAVAACDAGHRNSEPQCQFLHHSTHVLLTGFKVGTVERRQPPPPLPEDVLDSFNLAPDWLAPAPPQ